MIAKVHATEAGYQIVDAMMQILAGMGMTKEMPLDVERLLRPASVAIVGASANDAVISGIPQRVLARHGYTGAVCPVNPRYDEINGLRCYPDIESVPGPVDVALVVVNASRVVEVLDACGFVEGVAEPERLAALGDAAVACWAGPESCGPTTRST